MAIVKPFKISFAHTKTEVDSHHATKIISAYLVKTLTFNPIFGHSIPLQLTSLERDTARKQFDPIPGEFKERLTIILDDGKLEPDDIVLESKHYEITRNELNTLIKKRHPKPIQGGFETHPFHSVDAMVIEAYIGMACRHINTSAGLSPTDPPRCAMLTSYFAYTFESRIVSKVDVTAALTEIHAAGQDLLQLDYLFIPMHGKGSHWLLLGVAPKQGKIFIIDSTHVKHQLVENRLRQIVVEQVGDCGHNWPLLSPLNDLKNSRIWTAQHNRWDCGVFTMTFAQCLAFGYPLRCFEEKDMEVKRWRVAAELLHGSFNGPFKMNTLSYSLEDMTPRLPQLIAEGQTGRGSTRPWP